MARGPPLGEAAAEGMGAGEAAGGPGAEDEDDDEELFEECGESTVHLRSRRRCEELLLVATGQEATLLAGDARLALGRLLACAIAWIWSDHDPRRAHSQRQRTWLDGMQMLDALAARGLPITARSTARAMAVLRLMWKAGDATREMRSEWLAVVANAAVAAEGLDVAAATAEDIDAAEAHVLQALGWRVLVPSLHSWLTAFWSRLRVLARQAVPGGGDAHDPGPALDWVWKRACLDGGAVVVQRAATGQLAPRTLAMGLLGLALASVRMVSLRDIRPDALAADEWELIYFEVMGTPLPCLPPGCAGGTGRLLERAADCGMAEMREACGLAAAAVLASASGPS